MRTEFEKGIQHRASSQIPRMSTSGGCESIPRTRGLWLWVVADNLQVGAALNALLIAQLAIANRVIGK